MAIFSIAVRTVSVATSTAACEVIAGANNAFRLMELGFTINAGTASVLGYGTPTAKGVTPATESTVQAEDSGNTTAGNTVVALSWATVPTAPTNYLRRVSLPAVIGSGIIWTFPRGRSVLKTVTDVLYNLLASSVTDTWFVVDE